MVHRDLKPRNIMLTKTGAKLMDFGLAKEKMSQSLDASALTAAASGQPLTEKGTIVGTFQYMAPEQLQGHAADARSDIFALGAVLYEMITGKRAFPGKSQISAASAILEKDPEQGREPRWRQDGKELFYLSADGKMMAVPVKTGASFEARSPVALFQTHARQPVSSQDHFSYDVSGDDSLAAAISLDDASQISARPLCHRGAIRLDGVRPPIHRFRIINS